MVLVEMAFNSPAGLAGLVEKLAQALETGLEQEGLGWRPDYPITLRESLSLGLQQQIVGRHALPEEQRTPDLVPVHRVWIGLPEGGLRAWTTTLLQRVLEGCGQGSLPVGHPLRKQLQAELVQVLGPCLQRAESAS